MFVLFVYSFDLYYDMHLFVKEIRQYYKLKKHLYAGASLAIWS